MDLMEFLRMGAHKDCAWALTRERSTARIGGGGGEKPGGLASRVLAEPAAILYRLGSIISTGIRARKSHVIISKRSTLVTSGRVICRRDACVLCRLFLRSVKTNSRGFSFRGRGDDGVFTIVSLKRTARTSLVAAACGGEGD